MNMLYFIIKLYVKTFQYRQLNDTTKVVFHTKTIYINIVTELSRLSRRVVFYIKIIYKNIKR